VNAVGKWLTTVQVHGLERKAFWQSIFGMDTLPIVSVVPQWVRISGEVELQLVYMLDVEALSDDQRAQLVEALAKRFNYAVEWVDEQLERGVPILADDVTVSSSDWGQIVQMLDDDDDLEPWASSLEWGADEG